jgi:hypothetical protein
MILNIVNTLTSHGNCNHNQLWNMEINHICLACESTDLCKSVDGLVSIVKKDFKLDQFGNCLLFFAINIVIR